MKLIVYSTWKEFRFVKFIVDYEPKGKRDFEDVGNRHWRS
jgi:hypothetical protein